MSVAVSTSSPVGTAVDTGAEASGVLGGEPAAEAGDKGECVGGGRSALTAHWTPETGAASAYGCAAEMNAFGLRRNDSLNVFCLPSVVADDAAVEPFSIRPSRRLRMRSSLPPTRATSTCASLSSSGVGPSNRTPGSASISRNSLVVNAT